MFVTIVLTGLGLDLLNGDTEPLVTIFWIYCFSVWFSVFVGLTWLALMHGLRIARPDVRWVIWRNADLRAFWGLGFINAALAHSDVIIAMFLLPPEIVAIYAVAKRISMLLFFFLITANFVTATRITQAHTLGDMAEVQKQLKFSLIYASLPPLLVGPLLFALKVPIMTSFTPIEFACLRSAVPHPALVVCPYCWA
ncbi:hypothetical protein ACERZ8_21335 [Tateyamaria armeniaca]|uniref:Uncharacterized protein n=1 Tax=Tateyamaria armeniaca TaxID=2518930 RepID=A0ABW8V319_9RHOB